MAHNLVRIAVFTLTVAMVPVAIVRADDDPVIRGRKVSEWFKFIREQPDARLRQIALQVVDSDGGPKVASVLPGMIELLHDHKDAALRLRIVEYLPKYKERGDEVVAGFKYALQHDSDAKVREAAVTALGRMDRTAFTAIKEVGDALKDKDPATRAAAASTIAAFSRIDPEIAKDYVSSLATSLQDESTPVRLQAAFALGRMTTVAQPTITALIDRLPKEKDAAVRKEIVKTLASFGMTASAADSAVADLLQDKNVEVRQSAAIALGRISPAADRVMPKLLKAAHDPDSSVRCHAIHALGALGKPAISAIPELIDILKNDNVADVRLAVIEELASFGPDAKAATDVLQVATKDGRGAIREAAQEALKKIQQSP